MKAAAQWALPVVSAVLLLAAFGAPAVDLQPSALRVTVTAVVAVLAPLFWPSRGATPRRTTLRIVAWSLGAACFAGVVLRFTGGAQQPVGRVLAACAMLMLILIATHTFAAGFERRLCGSATDAKSAHEMAGRTATFGLALLGSLPLWFGPAGELIARRIPWMLDAIVAISPLTHLAMASGNDLLRNQWFYRHSNLATLQVSYPSLAGVILGYTFTLVALYLLVLRNHVGRPMTLRPIP